MNIQPLPAARFVRRTVLAPNEYRKNFRQIDEEVINALTSPEADQVTPLMSKIYLRLANAPAKHWERVGVLRFEAELGEGGPVKAWRLLCQTVRVSSATASKALRWMHEQGIIGYFAGKNGVGIRIFLNRATSSIGTKRAQEGEKILAFTPTSFHKSRTSVGEAAFSDSYADSESLEKELNPRAPKNGAGHAREGESGTRTSPAHSPPGAHPPALPEAGGRFGMGVVDHLLRELEPAVRAAAAQAATREYGRTREWLESKGLPKAARVAQRETFNLLRQHGLLDATCRTTHSSALGKRVTATAEANPLSPSEVKELAEACVAMLEMHGKAVASTLAELSADCGGTLLPEDVPRVRELAEAMALGLGKK